MKPITARAPSDDESSVSHEHPCRHRTFHATAANVTRLNSIGQRNGVEDTNQLGIHECVSKDRVQELPAILRNDGAAA